MTTPTDLAADARKKEVDAILRVAKIHTALVRMFGRLFTVDELADMFDQMKGGTGNPMGVLSHAVGVAWHNKKFGDDGASHDGAAADSD